MIIQNQYQNSSFPFVVTNSYCFNCEAINNEYEKKHESQFNCQSPSYLSFTYENIDDECSKNICDSIPKRKLFTMEEDNLLQYAVNKYQYKDWSKIAQHVPGRTPKQCRDRWTNYLHPSLKFVPWTHADNLLLVSNFRS